ncbi:hypothetical protein K1T71_004804 [Dendrolimus kikuchii]|uniref:Uncharacterized protein n=1 Tax=Dendrolimus kikuchii TaxID=765133 RepID=A0ACC1D6S1_9NEOP|nr:hypothetical protein K1T71_004804 [Dendrolimus kikuchii]
MNELKSYKCVNCGEAASALYKTYGPSVLKLTKCDECKGVVDKYIEYDPVIVMIDLVLMSREAQRHVLYNTEFKAYWKLFIILAMLETYGVWRSDSLFNIIIYNMCGIQNNSTINTTYFDTPINITVPKCWQGSCSMWAKYENVDDNDLFIWEKDFYVQFTSIFIGILVFITTVQGMMFLSRSFSSQNEVSITRVLKAFSLAYVSVSFNLPMLVWGNAETSPETRVIHYLLVFAYSFVVFTHVFTVLYECPVLVTVLILLTSHLMKFTTSFHLTPYLKGLIT